MAVIGPGFLILLVLGFIVAFQTRVEGIPQENIQQVKVDASRIVDLTDITADKPEKLEPSKAYLSQFPWQVLLDISGTKSNGLPRYGKCGGSIIDKEWVLTAAHCLVEDAPKSFFRWADQIRIYAGIIDNRKIDKAQFREIEKADFAGHVFINKKYNKMNTYDSDIALIKLKEGFNFNENVAPITLADEYDYIQDKFMLTSGWGCMVDDPKDDDWPYELRYMINLKMQKCDICNGNQINPSNPSLYEPCNTLCFREEKKSVCPNDSGGPVVTGKRSSDGKPYVQIGINSFRHKDKRPFLIVLTDLSNIEIREWIEETMNMCLDNDLRSVNPNYCPNGACHNGECQCNPGYTGDRCSEKETACPEGRGFFTPTGSKQCFKIFDTDVTWEEAQQICNNNGLALAHPWNAVELRSYLIQRYGSNEYWLGARKESNVYKWVDNGVQIYDNSPLWYTSNPSSNSQGCLGLLTLYTYWKAATDQPFWDNRCYLRIKPLCEFVPAIGCNNCQNGKCFQGVCLNFKPEKEPENCEAPGFEVGSECFLRVVDKPLTWQSARSYCQDRGYDLAEPGNVHMLIKYLWDADYHNDDYWIGGKDQNGEDWGAEESKWLWLSGRPISEGWNYTPEGRHYRNCLHFRPRNNPFFEDYFCYISKAFICQKKTMNQPGNGGSRSVEAVSFAKRLRRIITHPELKNVKNQTKHSENITGSPKN